MYVCMFACVCVQILCVYSYVCMSVVIISDCACESSMAASQIGVRLRVCVCNVVMRVSQTQNFHACFRQQLRICMCVRESVCARSCVRCVSESMQVCVYVCMLDWVFKM